ncbi:MAG: response regulator [Desulfobulbus sp.]|nr:response regulator [Desulfobulbus sp.]
MSAQSGLLHTWSHLHKTMKRSLRRLLASGAETSLHLQDVYLPALYRNMVERGSRAASLQNIKFTTKYDDRLPLVIQGNVPSLRLAVAMMLDYVMDRHASKVGYTTLEVGLAEQDDWDYVSFTVWYAGVHEGEDDGSRTWFSQDEMEQLAALMGGYFFAEDQHGTEPRYVIGVPLISGDPANAEEDSLESVPSGLAQAKEGSTALVVDDNPICRSLGVHLLSRHNIAADAAERGRTALKKLTEERYDLVFMDYSIPGLNGIRTTAIAREKGLLRTSFTIGMHSGAGSAENMETAFFEAGAQGYLDKPVDPLKLNLLLLDLLPRLHGQAAGASIQASVPHSADSARVDLIHSLSGIAGLDAEKGLAHMGHSVEIYASMLRRFTAELEEYIEPLLTLPLDGAWEEVAVRLHVLREFFVGIGATDLAQEAADLAAAVDAGGGSAYMPRIQSYCDDMMRLRARLVGLKTEDSQEETAEQLESAKPLTAPVDLTLKQQVSRLHDACLSHRATEAQTAADALRAMALPGDIKDQIETICALVDTLDYHEAHEQCARLLEAISDTAR